MNLDYKQKYLKYKTNYNNLKNIQGGVLDSGKLIYFFLTQEKLNKCMENQDIRKKIKNTTNKYIKDHDLLEELNNKLYDGNKKRCNFNLYGNKLYDDSSPLTFKLEKYVPYYVLNKNTFVLYKYDEDTFETSVVNYTYAKKKTD